MRLGPIMEPLKNTLAAEKMDYLAAGGNPVGAGKGRGVRLWGTLMVLSLVVCKTTGLHPENRPSTERQSPANECEQCFQTILKGQVATEIMAYQAQYDCRGGKENEYCTYNGTRYRMCQLEGEIVFHDPRPISKDGDDDDRVCLQFDKTFCFSRNEEGIDPESMQIAALPTDPELATEKFGQVPKVSKIMKLGEGKEKSKASEALAKFEEQTKTLANLDKNHFLANARKKFLCDDNANLINSLAISSTLWRNKQNEISIRLTHEIDIRKNFSQNETMRPDEIREGHRKEIRTIQPILDAWTA
ncbi:hypothetical protein HGM15179_019387 [Zosterops borbonicus]|uniref:Uncharacterized protein n=1 Tax=Zosterops borbonicus TaxID=364589 RepID=A0A8K1DAP0_9PASS|nr:hypothetical protein HGM15179_019387 [Zosterops borbonicus]